MGYIRDPPNNYTIKFNKKEIPKKEKEGRLPITVIHTMILGKHISTSSNLFATWVGMENRNIYYVARLDKLLLIRIILPPLDK